MQEMHTLTIQAIARQFPSLAVLGNFFTTENAAREESARASGRTLELQALAPERARTERETTS